MLDWYTNRNFTSNPKFCIK